MPKLEKQLEQYSTGSDENYRVYMSAEPAPSPDSHIIPQVSIPSVGGGLGIVGSSLGIQPSISLKEEVIKMCIDAAKYHTVRYLGVAMVSSFEILFACIMLMDALCSIRVYWSHQSRSPMNLLLACLLMFTKLWTTLIRCTHTHARTCAYTHTIEQYSMSL